MLAERQNKLIEELEHRSEQLSAVNKELEAFSYSVSHDLRAPLRHISGFTDLLERAPGTELDPARKRYLRLISESALKMGELIDALLVFSRMGRAEMLHTPVDLNAIVQNAMRDAIQADPARKVKWIVHRLPDVAGDPTTFCRTRSSTHVMPQTQRSKSASQTEAGARRMSWRFSCATTALASTWRMPAGSSVCFSVCTSPRILKVPALALRTFSGSCSDTAAGCGQKVNWEKGRRSSLPYRGRVRI
jgi:hypothetical protein